jgi:hypothetical protein
VTLHLRRLTPPCARHGWSVSLSLCAMFFCASVACADTINGYNSWVWNGFSRSSLSHSTSNVTSTNSSSGTSTPSSSGASLSGIIYYDVDADGVRDDSDITIRFASMMLKLDGSNTSYSFTTGKDGAYSFSDLIAGTYTLTLLTVSASSGTTSAGMLDGRLDTAAVAGSYTISNIALTATSTGINYDFAQYAYPSGLVMRLLMSDAELESTKSITTVPEPGTAALALLALVGLAASGLVRRLRNRTDAE